MDEMNYLEHYGVKGMRWGVRKDRSTSTTGRKRPNRREEARRMTDKELRDKINRLQMEQQYVKLTSSSYSTGKRKATSALKTFGKLGVKAVAVAGVYGGAQHFAKKYGLSPDEAARLDRSFQIIKILGS